MLDESNRYTANKPTPLKETYKGALFEEQGRFQEVKVTLLHQQALKGEFILSDMLDIYPEQHFTLENILELISSNFIDNYRKWRIKKRLIK